MSTPGSTQRAAPNRSGSQYHRKRASQACLTCRARKSRCDNQRPRCGFCISSGSDCNYPGIELTRLDRASLLILERLEKVEENILGKLGESTNGSDVPPTASTAQFSVDEAIEPAFVPLRRPIGEIWINGDRVMTWPSILDLIREDPESESWRRFRDDLEDPESDEYPLLFHISPTVLADEPKSSGEFAHKRFPGPDTTASEYADLIHLPSPSEYERLVRNYIIYVYSKYPVLDLGYLRHVMTTIINIQFDYRIPSPRNLPPGISPTDVAIFILVLGLGRTAMVEGPQASRLPMSAFLEFALPWMGLAFFGHQNPAKILQAQILLASNYMWIMRPWRAWQVMDSAATLAEKIIIKSPELKDSPLDHRVLWTLCKMQLELTEELRTHRPSERSGKLLTFLKTSNLPQPPTEPFDWPDIDPRVGSETWYYYLADTSSRRLVERIKHELYSGSPTGDKAGHLVSLHPLACELNRQVDEWSNALPAEFRASHARSNQYSLQSPAIQAEHLHYAMSKYLWNRQCQLRLIIFRPFMAFVAGNFHASPGQPNSRLGVLMDGAQRYLRFALNFLQSQSLRPERHYGSWLLGRNLWTTSLSVLAACNTPALAERMSREQLPIFRGNATSSGTREDSSMDGSREASLADVQDPICSYQEAIEAVEVACSIMRHWVHESPSITACLELLSTLLARTRERYS